VLSWASAHWDTTIECGDTLGSMTNELQPGEFIDEFFSGGPKNYAYRVINSTDITKQPKNVCKVMCVTLNYSASQLVNFEVIRAMILNGRAGDVVTVHTARKIKRKRKEGGVSILTEAEDKIYRAFFLKRRRLNDNSVPFGYK
jgi:hypothetical protein